LGARLIRWAAQGVPAEAPIRLIVDDSTKKKAGRQIEGVGHYCQGVGSARREYRTLRGLNWVGGMMRVPLSGWPGQWVSVPLGLSLFLKETPAPQLTVPSHSRSALVRAMSDFVAAPLPTRPIRVLSEGAMPPRTPGTSSRPWSPWAGASSAPASSLRCPLSHAGRAGVVPRRQARWWVAENGCPQTERRATAFPRKPGRWSKGGLGCGRPSCQDA
jgi:hypothetical protein